MQLSILSCLFFGSPARSPATASLQRSTLPLTALAMVLISACCSASAVAAAPPAAAATPHAATSLTFPARPANVDPGSWEALQIAATDAFATTPSSTITGKPVGIGNDGSPGDHFAYGVAVSADTAVIGVPADTVRGMPLFGSAYVFVRSGASWTVQTKLTASDGAAASSFGSAVAISGDTAVIGADTALIVATPAQGAAYVFTRTGTNWTQQAKLVASDGQASDELGNSVSVSGDTAIIGAAHNAGSTGAAYVFTRSGTAWTAQTKLIAPSGAPGDLFGQVVSIDTDTAAIGAPGSDIGANTDQGAAYVFTRSGTNWNAPLQLVAPDGVTSAAFGTALALSGSSVLIGAPGDTIGGNAGQGSAYVFLQSGTSWAMQTKLLAADGAAADLFGGAVALLGDDAAIGASAGGASIGSNAGATYVYTRSGSSWSAQAELFAADAGNNDAFGSAIALSTGTVVSGAYLHDVATNVDQGAAYVYTRSGSSWSAQAELAELGTAPPAEGFGNAVSVQADTAVVGASIANSNQGLAYVFSRVGSAWVEQATLLAPDGVSGATFGGAVSVDGDTVVVSASAAKIGSNTNQGAVYVFTRGDGSWPLQAKLWAAGGLTNDRLGSAVAVRGDTLVVGASSATVGGVTTQGAAYVFVRSAGTWTQQTRLLASDGAQADQFGNAVALDGDTVLVGSHFDDSPVSNAGSAYVFVRAGSTWTQQAKLVDSDAAASDEFGFAVALSGNTALIGTPAKGVAVAGDQQGAAYVFLRSGSSWTQQAKLLASDGATRYSFGASVALDGNVAAIGATSAATLTGTAYTFARTGTSWTQQSELTRANAYKSDTFGMVGISGNVVLVGAPGADGGFPYGNGNEGAAFFYTDATGLAATSTQLSSSLNPATQGQSVTLTASVSGTAPSGSVSFLDGASAISGCASSALSGSGDTLTATCVASALSPGNHSIVAAYGGDALNQASSSTVLNQLIRSNSATASQTTLASNANPINQGQALTLTATVSGNAPTGSVSFDDGAGVITNCSNVTLSGGTATCTTSALANGTHPVTAVYSGDGVNLPSSSTVLNQSVNGLPTISVQGVVNAIEDQPITVAVTVGDDATPASALTLSGTSSKQTIVTDASLASGFGGSGTARTLTVTPVAGAVGNATITLVVNDGQGGTAQATFLYQIDAVNHQPSFTVGASPISAPGATGMQTVTGFVTSVNFGFEDGTQTNILAYHVTEISDPANVVSAASIATNGTLTYTLSGNLGQATFSATLQDAYGTLNGGVDTSAPVTFTISVGVAVDLQVTMSNGGTSVYPGQTVLYEVMVANGGVNTATAANFADSVPTNLSNVIWSCTPIQLASCPVTSGSGNIAQSLTLPANAVLRFDVMGDLPLGSSGDVVNSAAIGAASGEIDTDLSSNSASDSDPILSDGIFRDGFDVATPTLSVKLPAGASIFK